MRHLGVEISKQRPGDPAAVGRGRWRPGFCRPERWCDHCGAPVRSWGL